MNDYDISITHFTLLAQSMGIGFLIGLERERHEVKIAGVRTFTLIALMGSLAGYMNTLGVWPLAPWIMLGLVVASLSIAQFKSVSHEPDTTTMVAAILTFILGHILWLGHSMIPAAVAIAVTAILYFRDELRNLPKKLTRRDITSFLQFAAVAFILLPILPNKTYGWYDVINPYQIGWLVVLISGISLLGYVALRLLRGSAGLLIMGALGGLVSTTATTLVYSRHSRDVKGFAESATMVILLSHVVMFARILVVTAVVEIQLLKPMLGWVLGGLFAGVLYLLAIEIRQSSAKREVPELNVSNPVEWKSALGFAFSFSLVMLLTAWMNDIFENAGTYLIAFVSGLSDVNAITVANLKLFSADTISAETAVNGVLVAFIANLLFKQGIVMSTADRSLWWKVALAFLVLLTGALIGKVLSPW